MYEHVSKFGVATATPDAWDHLDYVWGDKVGTFMIEMGKDMMGAPGSIVLSYKLQVRKTTCRFVMFNHMDTSQAMATARHYLETQEQRFPASEDTSTGSVKPLAFKRLQAEPPAETRAQHFGRRADKSSSRPVKGSTATKGKRPIYPHSRTLEGRSLCFRFQTKPCSAPGCAFAHACAQCFRNHGMSSCPSVPKGAGGVIL